MYHIVNKGNERHAVCYCWAVSSKNAVNVLRMIYPYLIIKAKQAKVLLSFREIQESSESRNHTRYSENIREDIYEYIRFLNKKGPESVETNTPNISDILMKIESELQGNLQKNSCEAFSHN